MSDSEKKLDQKETEINDLKKQNKQLTVKMETSKPKLLAVEAESQKQLENMQIQRDKALRQLRSQRYHR